MTEYCTNHKRTYINGKIKTSRCLKLNKNIDMNDTNNSNIPMECILCHDYMIDKSYGLFDTITNKNCSREELFIILSSTFKIIAEQMEEFDERIRKLEEG